MPTQNFNDIALPLLSISSSIAADALNFFGFTRVCGVNHPAIYFAFFSGFMLPVLGLRLRPTMTHNIGGLHIGAMALGVIDLTFIAEWVSQRVLKQTGEV
ncbi:uncharacterized protein RHO25_011176 [Cercospora beticola]|uniref:Uncharacterized protein n=1 Tax=Cercospora beticola TaxID=122368 RepID=A0ABZ0P3S9_CERBT|nr:hypothetical protein RHO25_011176 [Cercospora beticola]CAK1366427.1 unnamed protein product [Cercospora beticola]